MNKQIEKIINNCVVCIVATKKSGKQEGFLNRIEKSDVPMHTHHIDHLGPLESTAKSYKYIFVVIDAFTKFCWLYPVKDMSSEEAIKRLTIQGEIFGNPYRIISDKGGAFILKNFNDYCNEQNIQHITITTGVRRGNGQVERLNKTIISVLTKLSIDGPSTWYKHVARVQQSINSTTSRATGRTPFELLIGVKMRRAEDLKVTEIIEKEIVELFEDDRNELRKEASKQIKKIQEENRKYSLRKRKAAHRYRVHDLVAIQRTQFTNQSQVLPKFFGPYEVTQIKSKDRYDVRKVGHHEGPNVTSCAADIMKPWAQTYNSDESTSETDENQSGRL